MSQVSQRAQNHLSVQLFQLLKNSQRKVKFSLYIGSPRSHPGNGIDGARRGRSLPVPPPPGFSSHDVRLERSRLRCTKGSRELHSNNLWCQRTETIDSSRLPGPRGAGMSNGHVTDACLIGNGPRDRSHIQSRVRGNKHGNMNAAEHGCLER